MTLDEIATRGLALIGCGKMGGAMLAGWLKAGIPAPSIWVQQPKPSDWLTQQNVHLNASLPPNLAAVVVAVKPQMMARVLSDLQVSGQNDTVFISVAAGIQLNTLEGGLGAGTPILRAMPNTPAAIGRGITAIIGNTHAKAKHIKIGETLLSAIGQTVRLTSEEQMDAVTAISGSGPAYVFHLIETLAQAGQAQGLDADLALTLAKATVAGAGILAQNSDESPSVLRENVTSPNGTTAAALRVLMDKHTGLHSLIKQAVAAAAKRSKELANG